MDCRDEVYDYQMPENKLANVYKIPHLSMTPQESAIVTCQQPILGDEHCWRHV